ncbi:MULTISPECIES: DUF2827 domain-containing protein [Paraburkholderia]|uniref:DUF2827 domain-containing protein n=1 Tax=Paraburkholderia TaxID=1822464 RepID=UPI00224E95F6|nr:MULTISPECIES: DUF2827 domain-containing protein [Paraburkholderia]MCX4159618.1 DUF2827 domain-containing protein [Paraburkholderia aspalathi]MDN7169016.1 DUF2827 domain-containing protein [Paraburkholderia sp. SECH2]MDQ6397503.1 DUF2827 domain-containing protein [Paraburkholderia aspalathi]
MKVGISVLTHAGQSIWENGLGQNVIHLVRLLNSLPLVKDVVLIDCGDQRILPREVALDGLDVRVVSQGDATHLIDVAIELAGGFDVEWVDHIRALGKKVVFHCCGQPYAALVEPVMFGTSGFFSRADRCDEIWLLEQYVSFKPMLEALHRCPVFIVPYLWSPEFVDRRAVEVREHGFVFGYPSSPVGDFPPRGLKVAVFEPNISVAKASVIPMLICDEAFRHAPDSVTELHLMNTIKMKDHPTFVHLANSLDMVKQGKVRFEQRHDFVGYMSQYANAVVSHQWQNAQNYLYLDVLYGGYPLIHNSVWLGDVGYRYEGFNIDDGAGRLVEAYNSHARNLDSYRSKSMTFIRKLSPFSLDNQTRYARRLLDLRARSSSWRKA